MDAEVFKAILAMDSYNRGPTAGLADLSSIPRLSIVAASAAMPSGGTR